MLDEPNGIEAVLFDFAGVLTGDPFGALVRYAKASGIDAADFAKIAVGRGDYGAGDHPWHRLERGEIDLVDFDRAADEMARSLGYGGFPPLPVDSILAGALEVRQEMLELLGELRAEGVRTAILTNNVKALGAWRELADWDALVDVVIDSCEVGMRKPEARIFLHTCAALGVAPAHALFLDDMQTNIDGAAAVGLTGILVSDPSVAIESVKRLVGGHPDAE
jgi:epoxide hydrolase-like predicted phosphatase